MFRLNFIKLRSLFILFLSLSSFEVLFSQENRPAPKEKLKETQRKQLPPATVRRQIFDRSFNPAIGVILSAFYRNFTAKESEIPGFAVAEEGERRGKGISVDHTELNFSANADDKFLGSLTFALAEHAHGQGGHEGEDAENGHGEEGDEHGEQEGGIELELEEAYIQTIPNFPLFDGMSLKAGRAFWTLGYLNEHHNHYDDFSDRPLPYRVFLNNAFNDDGIELSYVLPTDLYVELGGGLFQGKDFPFSSDKGDAYSSFLRVGSDIAKNHSFRLGASQLTGESLKKQPRVSNEGEWDFIGRTRLYVLDFRYTWAPTGNARNSELTLQGEYFWNHEEGEYHINQEGSDLEFDLEFDGKRKSWYAQLVFKFHRQWRIGFRYSRLHPATLSEELLNSPLDNKGFNPNVSSVMIDWTNSEFSRLRLQYNREELRGKEDEETQAPYDEQFIFQYVISIGAHGAHKY